MLPLARMNVYAPEFLFFEMQHFRQNCVCWFSGPYSTRKMKFSNDRALEIQRNKFRRKTCVVETGSCFYKTASRRSLQVINGKTRMLRIYMKHWLVGALVGFHNALRVRGVGYKFDISPLKITTQVGYSHLLVLKSPLFKFLYSLMLNKKATLLKAKSADLILLHRFLSNLRNWSPPDVYRGKGIRYQRDFVFRKQGKKKKTN